MKRVKGYEAWRRRKDFTNDLYEKFFGGKITEADMNKAIESYNMADEELPECNGHIEGATALDGFIICKKCGINLKKV